MSVLYVLSKCIDELSKKTFIFVTCQQNTKKLQRHVGLKDADRENWK